MTTQRDPLDLAAIEARCEEATDGPWFCGPHYICDVHGGGRVVRSHAIYTPQDAADATFIAHARTDIPALCAEVRRLMADNERMRRGLAVAVERGKQNTPFGACVIAENMLAGREWSEVEGEVGRLRDCVLEADQRTDISRMEVERLTKERDEARRQVCTDPCCKSAAVFRDEAAAALARAEAAKRERDEALAAESLHLHFAEGTLARAEKAEKDRDAARRVIHEERILTHEAIDRAIAAEAREAGMREALLSCKNIACDSLTEPEKEEHISEIVDAALAAHAKGKGEKQ